MQKTDPLYVFVYGTLKPAERNHQVIERFEHSSTPARCLGLDLYDLQPEGYPAALNGLGLAHGYAVRFSPSEMEPAIKTLDRFEGVPSLYQRERRMAFVGEGDNATLVPVWVYVYQRLERLQRPGAELVASGEWTGKGVQLVTS